MRHQYWLKNLSAYLDNELSELKLKKMESHLVACTLCQSKLTQWKKIHEIQKEQNLLQPGIRVWQGIYYRMRNEPMRPLHFWEEDWVIRYIPSPLSTIATAAVVILITLSLQPYFTSIDSNTPVSLDQYLTNGTVLSSNAGNLIDTVMTTPDQS